jgi:hypothetical protein
VLVEDVAIRVRWSPEESRLTFGQPVVLTIPFSGVLLGRSGCWPGKERWNRWSGRVVYVQRAPVPIVTVKLQGHGLTLQSRAPVIGGNAAIPEVWDQVRIVVDPASISVQRLTANVTAPAPFDSRVSMPGVWLKGTVHTVQENSAGYLLSVHVAGVNVSALISTNREIGWPWKPGEPIEVQ